MPSPRAILNQSRIRRQGTSPGSVRGDLQQATAMLESRAFRKACGAVAQLGERVVRNDEVAGSIPARSTTLSGDLQRSTGQFLHETPVACGEAVDA